MSGIVVGVDGSELSTIAARWAADQAMRQRCSLTLVFALLPPTASYSFGPGMAGTPYAMDEIRESANEEILALAASLPGPDIQTRLVIGSPSGVLLEESGEAAMVVVGSRGMGGFRGLMMGSVSSQVSAHSRCPVVIIRAEPPAKSHQIVVGIDGSPASNAALDFAFRMAAMDIETEKSRIIALHSWDAPSYDLIAFAGADLASGLSSIGDGAERLVSEALGGFEEKFPDVEVEHRVVRGPAAGSLAEAAKGADLVVVGTRGHGRVIGAIVGSVSKSIMHLTSVPVAIVPSPSPVVFPT